MGSDIEALAKKLALEKFKKKNEYLKLETFIMYTNLRADGLQSLATKYQLKFKLKLPNQNFCSTSLKKISFSILKPKYVTLNEMKNSFKDSHFKSYEIKKKQSKIQILLVKS